MDLADKDDKLNTLYEQMQAEKQRSNELTIRINELFSESQPLSAEEKEKNTKMINDVMAAQRNSMMNDFNLICEYKRAMPKIILKRLLSLYQTLSEGDWYDRRVHLPTPAQIKKMEKKIGRLKRRLKNRDIFKFDVQYLDYVFRIVRVNNKRFLMEPQCKDDELTILYDRIQAEKTRTRELIIHINKLCSERLSLSDEEKEKNMEKIKDAMATQRISMTNNFDLICEYKLAMPKIILNQLLSLRQTLSEGGWYDRHVHLDPKSKKWRKRLANRSEGSRIETSIN